VYAKIEEYSNLPDNEARRRRLEGLYSIQKKLESFF